MASNPLLRKWPECHQVLLEHLSKESPWVLALPSISCVLVGGASNDATPVSAAWTALYEAACILDGVQDGDILVDGLHSPESAIGCATGLIFAAFHFLDHIQADPQSVRRVSMLFSEAAFRSSLGQHLGMAQAYESMPATDALEAYWQEVILKSGSIFQLAMTGGAAISTDSVHMITSLGEFGKCLGVILQILDDCRDVLAGSHIGSCEISLPLLLFFMTAQNDSTEGRRTGISDLATPLSKKALFDVLHETDVPAIISDVLLEWRRRALDSLVPFEECEAVTALEDILDDVLTSLPASD